MKTLQRRQKIRERRRSNSASLESIEIRDEFRSTADTSTESNAIMASPAIDVVQDHPSQLDWRLVVGFIFVSIAALYLF